MQSCEDSSRHSKEPSYSSLVVLLLCWQLRSSLHHLEDCPLHDVRRGCEINTIYKRQLRADQVTVVIVPCCVLFVFLIVEYRTCQTIEFLQEYWSSKDVFLIGLYRFVTRWDWLLLRLLLNCPCIILVNYKLYIEIIFVEIINTLCECSY